MFTQRDAAISQMSHERLCPGSRPHADWSTSAARLGPIMYLPTSKVVPDLQGHLPSQGPGDSRKSQGATVCVAQRNQSMPELTPQCSQALSSHSLSARPKNFSVYTQACLEVIILPGTAIRLIDYVVPSCQDSGTKSNQPPPRGWLWWLRSGRLRHG
jgi:hypothetical protein